MTQTSSELINLGQFFFSIFLSTNTERERDKRGSQLSGLCRPVYMFKIIPLLSDHCTPQLHCLPSGRAPDAARSFTGKKRVKRRRGRTHESTERGERQRETGEIFPNCKEGNYFKGYCCAAEKHFSVMRLISAALMAV